MQVTAILSALAEEQQGLREQLEDAQCVPHAGRTFWQGRLHGQPVVLALSRIGKVAAATTTTALVERFGARRIVFTGVAGGLGQGVRVGDVVVADAFVQHDMDASPLFPRYEVPLYGRSRFGTDPALTAALQQAARPAVGPGSDWPAAAVHAGLVLSGDRFVSSAQESAALQAQQPEALAVEMEGAAVAQVCHDYGVPLAVVRTISDRADDTAHTDFSRFVATMASPCARAMVENFLKML